MNKFIDNIFGLVKFIVAFLLLKTIFNYLYAKDSWIICEKPTEARDNGYHFYKYMRNNHPEVNLYYVIDRNSVDLLKVEPYKNVIFYNSFKHYLYYLASRVCLSSQSLPYPCSRRLCDMLIFLRRKDMKKVWLQHGITKDKLAHKDMDYSIFKYDLLCCTSKRESDFIQNEYGYSKDTAKLTGLCRYDNLIPAKAENIILIMPTFRSKLVAKNQSETATQKEMNHFKKSDFYRRYIELLKSDKLNILLKKYNYKVVFYPHYAIQSYIDLFYSASSDNVVIADRRHYDVQDLLLKSKFLITDYSSVFFDFAYMNKPELFYQFDKDEYRKTHYKQGYFDYDKDSFGKVEINLDGIIKEIKIQFQNNFILSDKYKNRANSFFAFHDFNNCKRTYDAVKSLI